MLNLPSLEEKQQTKEELKVANNQPGSLELELTSGMVIECATQIHKTLI